MVHEDTINIIEFNPRTSGVAGMANKISQKMYYKSKYVSILFSNKSEKNLNQFNFGYLFFIKKDILKNINK